MAKNKQAKTTKTTKQPIEKPIEESELITKFKALTPTQQNLVILQSIEGLNEEQTKHAEAITYLMDQSKTLPVQSITSEDSSSSKIPSGTAGIILQAFNTLMKVVEAVASAPNKQAENEYNIKARAHYEKVMGNIEARDAIELGMLTLKKDTVDTYLKKKIDEGADLGDLF